MTRDEAKRVMAAVQVLWPAGTLYPAGTATLAVDVWLAMLGDVDSDLAMAAVQSLATDGREFPPPVGAIRLRAIELGDDTTSDWGAAWQQVKARVGSVGRYGTPEWSDPTIAAAVRRIGWSTLCDATNETVVMSQFRHVYEAVSARERRAAAMPPDARRVLTNLAARLALGGGQDDDSDEDRELAGHEALDRGGPQPGAAGPGAGADRSTPVRGGE